MRGSWSTYLVHVECCSGIKEKKMLSLSICRIINDFSITDFMHLRFAGRNWRRSGVEICVRIAAARWQLFRWQMGRGWYPFFVLCCCYTQFNSERIDINVWGGDETLLAYNRIIKLIETNLSSITETLRCNKSTKSYWLCDVMLQCGWWIWLKTECRKPCRSHLLLRWIPINYQTFAPSRFGETMLVAVRTSIAQRRPEWKTRKITWCLLFMVGAVLVDNYGPFALD